MNNGQSNQPLSLSRTSFILLVTMLFYLLFAGFLIGVDLFHYNDPESAISVLIIYGLMGGLTSLFIAGKKYSLIGLIVITAILLVAQVGYMVVYATAPVTDPSAHDPFANLLVTVLNSLFPLLTLILGLQIRREN